MPDATELNAASIFAETGKRGDDILRCLPVGVVVVEADGGIVQANTLAHALLTGGQSLAGGGLYALFTAAEAETLRRLVGQAGAGQSLHAVVGLASPATPDTPRLLDVAAAPLPDSSHPGGAILTLHDVTGRARTDAEETRQALEHSEARAKKLAAANLIGMLFADETGCIVDANDVFLDLVGYTREDMTAGRLNWARMTPPEFSDRDRSAKEELAATGRCAPYEKAYLRKDGTLVPILITAAVLEGLPQREVAFVLDLTPLKATEDALRASNRNLRSLIEATPLAITAFDIEGNVTVWNPAAERLLGWKADEVMGRNVPSSSPGRRAEFRKHIEDTLSGNPLVGEEVVRQRKDGVPVEMAIWSSPLHDAQAQVSGMVSIIADMTERNRSAARERFLLDLNERVRAQVNPDEALWTTVCMVGEYLQLTRCSFIEVDIAADSAIVRRDYCPNVPSVAGTYPVTPFGTGLREALTQGQTIIICDTQTDPYTASTYETHYLPFQNRALLMVPILKDGQWISSLLAHMATPRSWTPDEIALVETVAERVQLAVDNARLAQAERERTEQLTHAIREVHHRVKNNLQMVGFLLEMQIPEAGETVSVEAVRDSLQQIRTIALVHDLLATDQPVGAVNVAEVLSRLTELLASSVRVAFPLTTLRLDAEPIWLPSRLAMSLALAVNELISNAFKHGRSLKIEKELPLVEVRMTRQGNAVCLRVLDQGTGFPADFDPRRAAHLGLDLVLTLVQSDLRGSISFVTRPAIAGDAGGGTVEVVFPLELPAE